MLRTTRLIVFMCLCAGCAASPAWADDTLDNSGLLGYWLCESGDCPDEAIELADNDGVQTYNSWLHDRPSAVDGRWTLDGTRLVIHCCEDVEYAYNVVEIGEERLVLQDAESPGDEIILHRPPAAGRRDEAGSTQAPSPP